MAKKKSSKKAGTLIRVSEEFADALKTVAGFEKVSMVRFADEVLMPVAKKRYRDGIIKAARRLEGGEE